MLKPDVVFFGENVPRPRVQGCFELLDDSACLLVLGSSLTVMSGLRFVHRAQQARIPVAIINRGATRGDPLADIKVDAALGEVLPTLARRPRIGRARPARCRPRPPVTSPTANDARRATAFTSTPRFQLFIIIALGETIVITGATTSQLKLTTATVAALRSRASTRPLRSLASRSAPSGRSCPRWSSADSSSGSWSP